MFRFVDLPTAYPLRDLFDAAVRRRTVQLTCRRCRHMNSYPSAALWWLFHRKGWPDRFDAVAHRFVCRLCIMRFHQKVRDPRLELTKDEPLDKSFPMPSELDWKQELRRRR